MPIADVEIPRLMKIAVPSGISVDTQGRAILFGDPNQDPGELTLLWSAMAFLALFQSQVQVFCPLTVPLTVSHSVCRPHSLSLSFIVTHALSLSHCVGGCNQQGAAPVRRRGPSGCHALQL